MRRAKDCDQYRQAVGVGAEVSRLIPYLNERGRFLLGRAASNGSLAVAKKAHGRRNHPVPLERVPRGAMVQWSGWASFACAHSPETQGGNAPLLHHPTEPKQSRR